LSYFDPGLCHGCFPLISCLQASLEFYFHSFLKFTHTILFPYLLIYLQVFPNFLVSVFSLLVFPTIFLLEFVQPIQNYCL
jgi:hypothetical protein